MLKAYYIWWVVVLPFLVNEKAAYEGPAPFIMNYNKQLETQGIPEWEPSEI